MKTSIKNTLITGTVTLICSVVSIIGTKEYISSNQEQTQEQTQKQNQSIVLNINGQEVSYVAQDIEELNNRISELKIENAELESDNKLLNEQINNTNSIPNISLENHKLFINGVEQNINNVNSIIEYNSHTYIRDDIITLINKNISIDKQNSKIIVGDNLGATYLLMKVCPPYETNYGYYAANGDTKDGSSIFNMAGETYTNGFKVDVNRSQGAQAIFNLKGEYNTLEFDLGHIDGTSGDKLHLKIILDGITTEIIEVHPEDLPTHYAINLNGAEQLIIDSIGESATMWGSEYGLANLVVIK